MFDLKKDWSISFAGCGFMGIYYLGAISCILERFPRFIEGASKIYGSSAGALMAAILTLGIPLDKCCSDLMFMAKEARKHRLGPLHPAYNLMQIVQDSLLASLPEDAHVRASGRLCVSLTRVPDGKNLIVSEFSSRDDLIEALICSCFVPLYCGVIPPTYRGVRYVDGAASDNLPRCNENNTVTFSAYAGESDICPRGSILNFHEVRFNNVSIQVNSDNVYRVTSTFFPPAPEAMAEICHSGYMDALRFLKENNLISRDCPLRCLETQSSRPACCELEKEPAEAEESNKDKQQSRGKPLQEDHRWLDPKLIENLPISIQKVLCEACRETHPAGGLLSHMTEYLPKKVTSYFQNPGALPVESARSLAQRLVGWIPDVPKDMSWFYGRAGDGNKEAPKDNMDQSDSESPLCRSRSLPLGLNLWNESKEDINAFPLSLDVTPTSNDTFTWKTRSTSDLPLTPPPTPTTNSKLDEATVTSPPSAGRGWALGRAVRWLRNIAFEPTSDQETG
ncbi:patatin-like phospholipase domain-containing protein 2 [Acanthochromis polyacanthus]|uniref:patatin-like phospholipase domain-containing protein 2 n=1 Tax=Acanthochromis polyacanthus TaxID=80966 RepID=UPI002234CBCB|nr:patatin-like phospholipase domain-containing protein 2 [Acanthochromis polyacanthus]